MLVQHGLYFLGDLGTVHVKGDVDHGSVLSLSVVDAAKLGFQALGTEVEFLGTLAGFQGSHL